MNSLHNKHLLVLGLGASGLAMARWGLRCGAQVAVVDTRAEPPQASALARDCPGAERLHAALDRQLAGLRPWDAMACSPGLSLAETAELRQWAAEQGVAWHTELSLFAQGMAELAERPQWPYRPQVLAITGTNGKTTVTALTHLLLQRAGRRVALAGNIGPNLLDVLSQALDTEAAANAEAAAAAPSDGDVADHAAAQAPAQADADGPAADLQPLEGAAFTAPTGDAQTAQDAEAAVEGDHGQRPPPIAPPPPKLPEPPHLPQVWVLELSSFQLDSVAGGPWDHLPTAATVLNITEDHLDWHGSMAAYCSAKQAIFGSQALVLLCRDDPLVMAFEPPTVNTKIAGRYRALPSRPWQSFGLDQPKRPGDWGTETVNGMDWLVRALPLDETRSRGRAADAAEAVYLQRLMPADALRLRGRHNASNALAALALACATGAPLAPMLHGLREYRGEAHRVQWLGMVREIAYFDDSKGTNVGATLAALKGLGGEHRLLPILGGDGKGQDFSPLAPALAQWARGVVLIGRDAALIESQIACCGLPLWHAADLPEAVRLATKQAQPGDAVLLSPACASLDMFNNYVHRAQVFVQAVQDLADDAGQALEVQ